MALLKDYYYISSTKVESYAAQIPAGAAKRLGAEVTGSLGVLSATLRTLEPRENTISRLKLVCDFLESHEDLGTTEFPKKWTKDRLRVKHIALKEVQRSFF